MLKGYLRISQDSNISYVNKLLKWCQLHKVELALGGGYFFLLFIIFQSVHFIQGDDSTSYAIDAINLQDWVWPFWETKFGYVFLLALFSRLTGVETFVIGRVIAFCSAFAFLFLTYLLIKQVFSSWVAIFTTLAVSATTHFWLEAPHTLTDMPFAAVVTGVSLLLLRKDQPKRIHLVLAGLISGFAAILRYNGILLVGLFGILIILNPYRLCWRERMVWLGLFSTSYLVTGTHWFWIVVVSLLQGAPGHIQDFFALRSVTTSPSVVRATGIASAAVGSGILSYLNHLLLETIDRLGYLAQYTWLPSPALRTGYPFILLSGLIVWAFRASRRQVTWLTFILLFIVGVSVQPLTHYRFYLVGLPALSFLTIIPAIELPKLIKQPKWQSTVSFVVGCSLFISLGLSIGSAVKQARAYHFQESQAKTFQPRLADWMCTYAKSHTTLNNHFTVAISGDSSILYYVERTCHDTIHYVTLTDEVIAFPEGIDLVVYEDYLNGGLWEWGYVWLINTPRILQLDNPLAAPDYFEAVCYFRQENPRAHAIIYRVLPRSSGAYPVVQVTTSSNDANKLSLVDGNVDTYWQSPVGLDAEKEEWITLDIGQSRRLNRLWLLPAPDGMGFPKDFYIQVSPDGMAWKTVFQTEDYPKPERQDPQVFVFPVVEGRYVRLVATHQGAIELASENYGLRLQEMRLSLGLEEEQPLLLSIAFASPCYDARTSETVIEVTNNGETATAALRLIYSDHLRATSVVHVDFELGNREKRTFAVGIVWPSGLYTTTARVTVQGNIFSQAAFCPVKIENANNLSLYTLGKEEISLLSYVVEKNVMPGDELLVRFAWVTRYRIRQDYTIFLHLVDSQGNKVAQRDSQPREGRAPTSYWETGYTIWDTHQLAIPPEVAPGEYDLIMGMYNANTMERLEVKHGDKSIEGGAFVLTRIKVLPTETSSVPINQGDGG